VFGQLKFRPFDFAPLRRYCLSADSTHRPSRPGGGLCHRFHALVSTSLPCLLRGNERPFFPNCNNLRFPLFSPDVLFIDSFTVGNAVASDPLPLSPFEHTGLGSFLNLKFLSRDTRCFEHVFSTAFCIRSSPAQRQYLRGCSCC